MTTNERKALVLQLKNELGELQAERKFMQGQTGHHVSREIRDKYASDEAALRNKIAELEKTILSN